MDTPRESDSARRAELALQKNISVMRAIRDDRVPLFIEKCPIPGMIKSPPKYTPGNRTSPFEINFSFKKTSPQFVSSVRADRWPMLVLETSTRARFATNPRPEETYFARFHVRACRSNTGPRTWTPSPEIPSNDERLRLIVCRSAPRHLNCAVDGASHAARSGRARTRCRDRWSRRSCPKQAITRRRQPGAGRPSRRTASARAPPGSSVPAHRESIHSRPCPRRARARAGSRPC